MRDFRVAYRNVVRQQRRSFVALLAIACGVAALLFAGGFIEWILRELREQTIRSQLGHIQVVRQDGSTRADARDPASPGTAAQRALIERSPNVKAVSPRLSLSGLISHGDNTLAFIGEGVDARTDITASSADDLVSGAQLDASSPHRVLLGEGLATSLGVKPGDLAVVLVNLPGGSINASDVVVGGTFRTVSKTYDDAAIRVPLGLARELMKNDGADRWIVTLTSTAATNPTLAMLRNDPALAGLRFIPWTELSDFYNKAVVLYARQFLIMQMLIAVIIVLSISNMMMMSVTERRAEIGTMMAIGTLRRDVARIFVLEGVVVGVVGGLAGVLLGFAFNSAISIVGIPMPPPPGMRHGFVAGASFDAGHALPAFMLAVITTTAASVYPAITASRLAIVDALRVLR